MAKKTDDDVSMSTMLDEGHPFFTTTSSSTTLLTEVEPFTPSYGRKFYPNLQAEYYPMEAHLQTFGRPATRIWTPGELLNQGSEGSCVGHAFKGLLTAEPNVHLGDPDAWTIYREAQKRDPWRNKEHSGTTVQAAAEYLHEAGLITQYVWARTGHEIVRWLSENGPVVLGTMWFESMNEPNDLGFVRVVGEPVGGHAYCAYGYVAELNAVLCRNSWGEGFGLNGDFYIKFSDLDVLLRSYGEACAAVERAV
jgi:hypothetical protein